jgi:hypothetical protein
LCCRLSDEEDNWDGFGNAEPVRGREACRDALAAFYDTINGLHHQIVEHMCMAA